MLWAIEITTISYPLQMTYCLREPGKLNMIFPKIPWILFGILLKPNTCSPMRFGGRKWRKFGLYFCSADSTSQEHDHRGLGAFSVIEEIPVTCAHFCMWSGKCTEYSFSYLHSHTQAVDLMVRRFWGSEGIWKLSQS